MFTVKVYLPICKKWFVIQKVATVNEAAKIIVEQYDDFKARIYSGRRWIAEYEQGSKPA